MSEIRVTKTSHDQFNVVVSENGSESNHFVTLSEVYFKKLCRGSESKEDCIRSAFHFLLDRESKESILSNFDLKVISKYFGDFETQFQKY